jgi:cytochrome c oxidase assembly protein subunit 15
MKEIATKMPSEALKYSLKSRQFAIINGVLVATTVVSGAFVAGNDAGNAYNTFPKMGDEWIPNELLNMKPIWKNFLENTATVQFDHRILALTTLTSIMGMYGAAKTANMGMFWKSLPQASKLCYNAVAGMSIAQVGLGIGTLLMYVPIPLAAIHQFGSLTLLSFVTYLVHTLNFSKYARLIGVSSTASKVLKKII